MRPLRYSINVTLDGCWDHRAMFADEDLHRHAVENLNQADALLFGRVTYEMMQAAWRLPARTGARPDWMEPFARTIHAAKKYVVSSTLDRVDWNAELVRGDLGKAVQQLKRESGKGLFVGGVKLPLALAELGLIDEYEFVVQPRLAGHGPTTLVRVASNRTNWPTRSHLLILDTLSVGDPKCLGGPKRLRSVARSHPDRIPGCRNLARPNPRRACGLCIDRRHSVCCDLCAGCGVCWESLSAVAPPNKRLTLTGPAIKGSGRSCPSQPVTQAGALAPAGARPAA